jgi:chromosome partitioning protein
MAVFAFVNQKGGCAKSTTAVHFAYWLFHRRKSVYLIDADAQRSSSYWLESLDDEIPHEIEQKPKILLERIPELARVYQHVVVDGPAGLSDATKAIISQADLAVIPCQPSGVDIRSAADAIQLIQQAQAMRDGLPMATIFLSRAVPRTRLLEEAIAQLNTMGLPLLNTVIHQKQAIADTFGQAATVWELLGSGAADAAQEYEQLFKEILKLLRQGD